MSGLDRQRAQERRRRKRGGGEPFATMPPGHLLAAAYGLSTCGLRVLLLAHAGWVPDHGGKPGTAVLPFAHVADPRRIAGQDRRMVLASRPSKTTITTAVADVIAAGFMAVGTLGTKPRGPGGNQGRAAGYRVPVRDGDHAAARLHLPPGARAPEGKIRWSAKMIRRDCVELSPLALRLLILLVARGDRDAAGNLRDTTAFPLAAREVAKALGVAPSTAAAGITELVSGGRLIIDTPPAGRRCAIVRLHQRYERGHSGCGSPSPHGSLQEVLSPNTKSRLPVLSPNTKPQWCPGQRVAFGQRTAPPSLCSATGPGF